MIHEIENFKSNDFNTSMKEKYTNFRNALDYKKIANKYLKIFEKVEKSLLFWKIFMLDLSTDINHLKVNWLNNFNSLIIGSRPLGVEIGTPFIRRIYGKVLNYLIRIIFSIEIVDTQCGFKFLSTNKIAEIINEIEFGGFIYDLDLIMTCKKLGFNVIETPVKYNFDDNTSISLLRDPILIIKDLIKLKKKF